MSIDPLSSVGTVGAVSSAAAAGALPARPADGGFSTVLQRQLEDARAGVAGVRAEIASLRAGGARQRAFAAIGTAIATGAPVTESAVASRLAASATGDAADPFGWRRLARETADRIIGPGSGALFERQIQQESGFAPDVVFGTRRSSAGAEGIAQLMPQFYPNVNRTDPASSLAAGAQSMQHYLSAWNGDVRKALASYNAGLGRVQQLVAQHGARWEQALPQETRDYLAAIVGGAGPSVVPSRTADVGVFGGRGPSGVLTMPVARLGARGSTNGAVDLFATPGTDVRSPADGVARRVYGEGNVRTVVLDHGNGWISMLTGVADTSIVPGAQVRRGDVVGAVDDGGVVGMTLALQGRTVDPTRYFIEE